MKPRFIMAVPPWHFPLVSSLFVSEILLRFIDFSMPHNLSVISE